MSSFSKIRLTLFLLTVIFIGAAISVNLVFNKQELIRYDGRTIEKNLHRKERLLLNYFNNPANFKKLQTVDSNEKLAAALITDFRNKQDIILATYKNGKLVFWGGEKLVPESDAGLKNGSNLIKWDNGWFEVIKKSSGAFSVLGIIPVKADYSFQNSFLVNDFSDNLIRTNNIEIARASSHNIYRVHDIFGKYLFSIRLKSAIINSFYSTLELVLWIAGIISCCLFITSICVWIASKNGVKTAFGILFVFFFLLRIINLQSTWFYQHFNIPVFEPQYFSYNQLFPTIGDTLLNFIAITWFLTFVYAYRSKIKFSKKPLDRQKSLLIFALLGIFVAISTFFINNLFYELVAHSRINFDLTDILNLNGFGWLGIGLLCIALLDLFIIIDVALTISASLSLTRKEQISIFIAGLIIIAAGELVLHDFNFYFIALGAIIFFRGWVIYHQKSMWALTIVFLLAVSILASVKLAGFQFYKEREQRKVLAQKLESGNDLNALLLFADMEKEIRKDKFIRNFFKSSFKPKYKLTENLNKNYFNGYLSRYKYEVYSYSPRGTVYDMDSVPFSYFRRLIQTRAERVSNFFYRITNTFGYYSYVAVLPVEEQNTLLGTLILELKSKSFKKTSFPEFLQNETFTTPVIADNYSIAFYQHNKLLYQYGKYIYDIKNTDFDGKPDSFIFKDKNGYNHLIYQQSGRKLIVISRPITGLIMQLGSVSFLFLVLLIFSAIISTLYWLGVTLSRRQLRREFFSGEYFISRNPILYRTRIQASMVGAILTTLFIIGIVTYFSIRRQFRQEQQDNVTGQVNQIAEAFEKKMFENGKLVYDDETLSAFANVNASDLNLYDVSGRLIFSTQPKIFDYHLISSRMNALAYVYLNKYQRSEYLNPEMIGNFTFFSAYKPIRNENNETVAYLGLPNYHYQEEVERQVGSFLNTLINVYALVLVTVGLFAVFVANKITFPLTLVQKSLAGISIGAQNQPISWKRNDEIGHLIKEYNNMIVALEESAKKLARSERESAWREMAKQIAHEIKNPLTPLKLGVQLLEKSWQENDPNFEKKFEKFTKSSIEQIESLSRIASEFSTFAKMPDTTLENIDLKDVIEQAIQVYEGLSELNLALKDETKLESLIIKGNKEQLLRIFNNLIKNAIEAIPDYKKGEVSITLKERTGEVIIEVADNGGGIPENLRGKIFHPNFTTKTSGTGLGLTFVKQAVVNMNGNISFETEPEKGTTFYIDLPLV